MKHRLLLHSLSHTFVVVDITNLGLPDEIYPTSGKEEIVPCHRFQGWEDARRYLLTLGADDKSIERSVESLRKTSTAVLTIV